MRRFAAFTSPIAAPGCAAVSAGLAGRRLAGKPMNRSMVFQVGVSGGGFAAAPAGTGHRDDLRK
jgi:hypothetical protein